jgi:hypothetical protein
LKKLVVIRTGLLSWLKLFSTGVIRANTVMIQTQIKHTIADPFGAKLSDTASKI